MLVSNCYYKHAAVAVSRFRRIFRSFLLMRYFCYSKNFWISCCLCDQNNTSLKSPTSNKNSALEKKNENPFYPSIQEASLTFLSLRFKNHFRALPKFFTGVQKICQIGSRQQNASWLRASTLQVTEEALLQADKFGLVMQTSILKKNIHHVAKHSLTETDYPR